MGEIFNYARKDFGEHWKVALVGLSLLTLLLFIPILYFILRLGGVF